MTITSVTSPDPRVELQAEARRPGWGLFFVLNAILFLRPEEFISALAGASLYQWCILACIVVCAGPLLEQVRGRTLAVQPVTACVLGLLVTILLSHAQHLRLGEAARVGIVFFKVLVYYLLVVVLIDSPVRLRQYLKWIVGFTLVLAVISLLNYHNYINVAALTTNPDVDAGTIDPQTGLPVVIQRLQSVGIFENPNDFARLLVIAILVCIFQIAHGKGAGRVYWALALITMAYALKLTYSRGGLMALGVGLAVLFSARYGWKKTILLGLVTVPLALVFFEGRQTDLNTSEGTAQQRIQIWSDGLVLLRNSVVFGIGMEQYANEVGYVAHNSFMQCYVELGIVGGTLFTGAFYLTIVGLREARRRAVETEDPEVTGTLCALLLAIIVSYVVGMLSSTRSYSEPTYALLGAGTACLNMFRLDPPARVMRLDRWVARRVVTAGVLMLLALYLYVRVSARYSTGA